MKQRTTNKAIHVRKRGFSSITIWHLNIYWSDTEDHSFSGFTQRPFNLQSPFPLLMGLESDGWVFGLEKHITPAALCPETLQPRLEPLEGITRACMHTPTSKSYHSLCALEWEQDRSRTAWRQAFVEDAELAAVLKLILLKRFLLNHHCKALYKGNLKREATKKGHRLI